MTASAMPRKTKRVWRKSVSGPWASNSDIMKSLGPEQRHLLQTRRAVERREERQRRLRLMLVVTAMAAASAAASGAWFVTQMP